MTFAPTMFSMPIEASGYYSEDSTLSMSIYEYASAQEVADQKAAISSTGYSIKTVDGTTTQVEWVAPPHFFAGEKYIVLYCGSSADVLSFLEELLGPQFAGARGVRPGKPSAPAGKCQGSGRSCVRFFAF